ncbi:terminase [Saccharothrix sp. NRRL B-16348]|uniref:terminase n=1 Tax=Saccharothrix sp. NRRL B-16348 TaxID=1415542 RepID=UPI001E38D0F6|nr:terminase [Saccharothrix sp. NRRL B-16348]
MARQNGKTWLLKALSLYWLFVERQKLILSTSTNLDYAREVWSAAVDIAEANPWLRDEVESVRKANGEQTLTTVDGCRYKIAASNRKGGRSLTINRLVLDELREHSSWDAWNASTNATNAIPDAQVFALSNQGDDTSVVLDALRQDALTFLETGQGDYRLGLFEYSAPDGSAPTDLDALSQANPSLGIRMDVETLMGPALRAEAAGGEQLAGFRTEVMCQRVHLLDPAIDPTWWGRCGTEEPLQLKDFRDRVALCVDVSLAGDHATLVAAAKINGKVHVEVIKAWEGYGCLKLVRQELPALVRKIKPRAFGWFPMGPGAQLAADLADRKHRRSAEAWPPPGVVVEALTAETAAVCMGLSEQVLSGDLSHPDDDVLNDHVRRSQKQHTAGRWTFARTGSESIEGAYALAGAVHLARTLPPPRTPLTAA